MSKKNGKFMMTQKEAQAVVDSIENRRLPLLRRGQCPMCVHMIKVNKDCEECPGERFSGSGGHCAYAGKPIRQQIKAGKEMLAAAGYYIDEVDA